MVDEDYGDGPLPSEVRHRRRVVDGVALRKAIRDGLRQKNMTVAEAARRAGLKTGSAVHNVLSQESETLSYATALRLSKVLGFDLTVLSDLPPLPASEELEQIAQQAEQAGAPAQLHRLISRLRKVVSARAIGAPTVTAENLVSELVMVTVHVDEEGPRTSLTLPEAEREPLTGRMSSRDAGRRAFGARVIGLAAQPVYKTGTVLICVPIAVGVTLRLAEGRHVLCCVRSARKSQATRWKRFNVEVRTVARNPATGVLELVPTGVDLDARSVDLPSSLTRRPWTSRGFDIKVAGVVISSVVPEEGNP